MHSPKASETSKSSPGKEIEQAAPTAPFADHRPVARQQRAVQKMASESPQVQEGLALQMKVNNSARVKQLQDADPTRQQPDNTGGFVGTDGQIVQMELVDGQIVIRGENASEDLRELVTVTNNSGSATAIAQVMEIVGSPTRVHVRVVDEVVDNGLYGLHQAHDADGNALNWNRETNDFDGVPAYAGPGVYAEATITVYKGNIIQGGGNASSHRSAGMRLSPEQLMAGTFQHEAHHDTDREFIEDLRNRRNGRAHNNVDAHDNIHPQDHTVYGEMGDAARSREEGNESEEGSQKGQGGFFRKVFRGIKRIFGGE